MSEFKTIETQEQLDAIIGERVARARQKALEEFSDYDSIKTQLAELSNTITSKDELLNANQQTITDLQNKIAEYETHSAKRRIALEVGISESLADRLVGDSEESMRADAEKLKALMGTTRVTAPMGSTEPQGDSDDPYKKLVMNLTRKGE